MLRSLIEEFLLFIVPFLAFMSYLILTRRHPLDVEHWRPHVFWLSCTGLLLAIASLIYTGVTAPRHLGSFDPPHIERGQVVPGQFNDKR